jgi:hypothetical protein
MTAIQDFLNKITGNKVKDAYRAEIAKVSAALDAGNVEAPELLAAMPTLLAACFQTVTEKDVENYMRHTAKQIIKITKKIPKDARHDISEGKKG